MGVERFYIKVLNVKGRLSSPGGDIKLFMADNDMYSVKWQRSKNLVILKDNSDKYVLNMFKSLVSNDKEMAVLGDEGGEGRTNKFSA